MVRVMEGFSRVSYVGLAAPYLEGKKLFLYLGAGVMVTRISFA